MMEYDDNDSINRYHVSYIKNTCDMIFIAKQNFIK